ncbi:hypothetical protein L3Q82_007011 [Scortum barcoo]|uniref:Uncharacterized protein n=1 Tax=Scortum barcoo TaxID=214431 RepID=A0ACB8WWG0_9TELE|nr:hypothetical protein L3Q82_007011 [Scortum barcoo]
MEQLYMKQQTDQQQNIQTDIRQQTDQQSTIQNTGEQTEGLFRFLPQRGAESQEVQQEEMETDEHEMKTEEIRHQPTIRQSTIQPAWTQPTLGAITKALSAQGIIVGKHDFANSGDGGHPSRTYLTAWPGCRLNLVYSLLAQQAQKELHQALALPWLPDQLFQPHQPSSYSSDNAKIGYVVNLLRGKASDWATALWQANSPVLQSFDSFIAEMKKVFDHPVQGQEAVKRLLDLRQGSQSVAAYSVDFRILAAASASPSPPPLEPTISEVPDLSSVPSVYHDLAPCLQQSKGHLPSPSQALRLPH